MREADFQRAVTEAAGYLGWVKMPYSRGLRSTIWEWSWSLHPPQTCLLRRPECHTKILPSARNISANIVRSTKPGKLCNVRRMIALGMQTNAPRSTDAPTVSPRMTCALLCRLADASIAAGLIASASITLSLCMLAARTPQATSSAAATRAMRGSTEQNNLVLGQGSQTRASNAGKRKAGTRHAESVSVVTSEVGAAKIARRLTERQWQDLVVEAALRLGWLVYHTYDSRRSAPGFPDLILVKGPRLLAIELKTMTGKVRPEQHLWLAAISDVEQVTSLLARPADWDQIEALLKGEAA